jgi:hypothetical protein
MDPTPSEVPIADEAVEAARPGACWTVRECDWRHELPDGVAELLAPPVIVSAEAFVPATAVEAVAPVEEIVPVYRPKHAAPEDSASRSIAPTLARRLRRRPLHALWSDGGAA